MAFNIAAAGMVTPVGFRAPTSCAAIRAALDGFQETRFMFDGDWLRAGVVAFPDGLGGREKLLQIVVSAIEECLAQRPGGGETALLLCLCALERPGRHRDLGRPFLEEVLDRLGRPPELQRHVYIFETGSFGGVDALQLSDRLLVRRKVDRCLVVGVDSLLTAKCLTAYHKARRLVTRENADGFLPGEGAAAILLEPARVRRDSPLQCLGIGRGTETATLDAGKPLRAQGLTDAYRAAFAASSTDYTLVDYRLCDISGEQYAFKDAALALTRTMRVRKPEFDLWHPCDCVGNLGAANVPLVLGVALAAAQRGYAPGPGILCHFSADDGRRAALVLREYGKASHPSL